MLILEADKLQYRGCDGNARDEKDVAVSHEDDEDVTSSLEFVERLMTYLTGDDDESVDTLPSNDQNEACPPSMHMLVCGINNTCLLKQKHTLQRNAAEGKDASSPSSSSSSIQSKLAKLQRFISTHLCVFYMEDEAEKEEQRDFRNLLLFHTMRCPRVVSVIVPRHGDEEEGVKVLCGRVYHHLENSIDDNNDKVKASDDVDDGSSLSSPLGKEDGDAPSTPFIVDVMQYCLVASVQTANPPSPANRMTPSPSSMMLSVPSSPTDRMPSTSSYSSLSSNMVIGNNTTAPKSHKSKKRTLCMTTALSAVTDAFSMVDVLLGTRCEDPAAQYQQNGLVDATSKGWPSLIRVSPIFNWSYPQVWQYIFDGDVPFCPVYAHGYSSIGGKDTCGQNPHLLLHKEEEVRGITSSDEAASIGVEGEEEEKEVVLPTIDSDVLASWVSWWGRRREYFFQHTNTNHDNSSQNYHHYQERHHHRNQQRDTLVSWSLDAVVATVSKMVSSPAARQQHQQDLEVGAHTGGTPSSSHIIPSGGWGFLIHEFTTELDTINGAYDPSALSSHPSQTTTTTTTAIESKEPSAAAVDTSVRRRRWWPGWVLIDGTLERAGRHIHKKKPL